mgnify:CR=1 FL=1
MLNVQFERDKRWGYAIGVAFFITSMVLFGIYSPNQSYTDLDPKEGSAMAWLGLIIIIAASCLIGRAINHAQGFDRRTQDGVVAKPVSLVLASLCAVAGAIMTPWVSIENWRPAPTPEHANPWLYLAHDMGNFFIGAFGPIIFAFVLAALIVIGSLVAGAVSYGVLHRRGYKDPPSNTPIPPPVMVLPERAAFTLP